MVAVTNSPTPTDREATRFDRQTRFAPFGEEGQANLERSRVLLVGAGALGGVLAQNCVRAGVGELVIVDRDVVEYSNLPRQVLFTEEHAREATPKALAAAETLARVGGPSTLTPIVGHLDADLLIELGRTADLILDGTDNLETRYLINDFALKERIPWVYAGVVGACGLVMPVVPESSACLACLFPEPPPSGSLPTCDTAGVLGPAVGAIASLAAGLGLRLLARPEARDEVPSRLVELDVWNGAVRSIGAPRDPECRACGTREFRWLEGAPSADPISLCGRNTVQIPSSTRAFDLEALAARLQDVAEDVVYQKVLLRFRADEHSFTVFQDGRALIEGTEDLDRARSLYARFVGQ